MSRVIFADLEIVDILFKNSKIKKAKEMKGREVYLIGMIGAENINKTIEEIRKLYEENPQEEIALLIGSGGGAIGPALNFYEWVKLKNIPLVTIAIGEVSSAAVIVFLAGQKRKATSHSYFILHKGGSFKEDIRMLLLRLFSPSRYRDEADWWKTWRKFETEIVKKKTKIPPDEIEKALTKEHLVLTPGEAKKFGLIDEIIESH
jgi:ATP-dependent protease ClpP protease subunit